MSTLNPEIIEKVVKVNKFNSGVLRTDIENLIKIFGELSDCYSGDDLRVIFEELLGQNGNLMKIFQIVESYSECLLGIRDGYLLQEQKFQNSLNRLDI